MLIVGLNILLSPSGTFLAACFDKRGVYKWMICAGIVQLIPTMIFYHYYGVVESYYNYPEKMKDMEQEEAEHAIAYAFSMLCIFAFLFFLMWIYGVCLACHIY